MRDFNVRRRDKSFLLVLFITVNASILLNHLFFVNYLPISCYIISVVITMSIGAYGALMATFVLVHQINFNPYILHIRGWDTSAGLLKALLKRKVMNINIQVPSIRTIEFDAQGNILTIHFAEDGLLKLSTEVFRRKDIEALLPLLEKHRKKPIAWLI